MEASDFTFDYPDLDDLNDPRINYPEIINKVGEKIMENERFLEIHKSIINKNNIIYKNFTTIRKLVINLIKQINKDKINLEDEDLIKAIEYIQLIFNKKNNLNIIFNYTDIYNQLEQNIMYLINNITDKEINIKIIKIYELCEKFFMMNCEINKIKKYYIDKYNFIKYLFELDKDKRHNGVLIDLIVVRYNPFIRLYLNGII